MKNQQSSKRGYLNLDRKHGEKIIITTPHGEKITILLAEIRRYVAKIAIEAPIEFTVHREEVQKMIDIANRDKNI